jgi:hypothetical protein
VCRIPEAFNERLLTRRSLFNVADDHLDDRDEFVAVVANQLERTPHLVDDCADFIYREAVWVIRRD